MMSENLLHSDVNFLNVIVGHSDVPKLNVKPYVDILNNLLTDSYLVHKFRHRVDLAFEGYDSDAREIFKVPEIRKFVKKFDEVWPFWFFFMSKQSSTLKAIAFCLSSYNKVAPGLTRVEPGDLEEFLNRHFHYVNILFEKFGLPEDMNIAITEEITDYFGGK